ncbi:MAG: DUF2326 domain-containing protein [Bacilli bacterium]|nr:DUF2326 domain-containing protein [Bacilli bacterium]
MLVEISCDKFKENGNPRGTISFRPGLNAVLGIGTETNSIGKSTFLMIIDFCFGGDDYINKEKIVVDHIGHHEIHFAFEFNGRKHYFSRGTSNPNYVFRCTDSRYLPEGRRGMHKDDFRSFLSEMYQLNYEGVTFRQAISRFFRIYNRQTHNELKPLNATVNEEDRKGIVSIMKIYGLYGPIDALASKVDAAEQAKTGFDFARKHSLAPIAASKDEYNANVAKIKRLRAELEQLLADNDMGRSDPDIIRASEESRLRLLRKELVRERGKITDRLDSIQFDYDYDEAEISRSIDRLKTFFPGLDFSSIAETEQFHKKVRSIIEKEFRQGKEDIEALLARYDEQIAEIDKRLQSYPQIPDVKKAIMDRHTELQRELERLEAANANYDKKGTLTTGLEKAKQELDEVMRRQAGILQSKINARIEELAHLFGDGRKPPYLSISSLSSYVYCLPDDNGTGNRFKAVALLDLAIMEQTNIPAICHDTIVTDSLDAAGKARLIDLYTAYDGTSKQVFISFDNPEGADEKTKKTLYSHEVLRLSKGTQTLYGIAWAAEGAAE